MHKSTCYSCGYYKEERESDGSLSHYCNDLDCYCDPNCNYN